MTLAGRIAWDDTILPFQLDRADIRGRVGRLDATLERVQGQHAYPAPVAGLVAEAALLTALIGQTVRPGWKLSLQVRGQGAIRLIATDYFAPEAEGAAARLRAYAGYDREALDPGAGGFGQLGRGLFAIMIDQNAGAMPYQGITPIAGHTLAHCAETYFAQSEQLPTRFALAWTGPGGDAGDADTGGWRAGGVMLQHLPKGAVAAHDASGYDGLLAAEDLLEGADAENWNRAVLLAETVAEDELLGPEVGAETLLLRLFHEEAPRVYPAQAVEFGCTCSAQKVVASLSGYSRAEIAELITEEGTVTADCQFCGAHYAFAPEELGADEDG